jgi:hypothetical protein
MNMKLHYQLIITSFLLPTLFIAQTGPGGVGNSTNNNLWLRADAGTFTDAGVTPAAHTNQIQQWNDQSGNGRNATQGTAANRPLFHLNAANGRPGLRYTGNMFIDPPALGLANNGSYTYILTFRDTVTGIGGMNDGSGHFILDRTTASNALVSLKPTTGNFYGYQKRNDAGGGLGGPLTTTSINTNVKSIQMRRNFNVNYQIFYNAALQATLADADGNTTPPNPRIGRHATTANGGIRGFIYEFIIYNFALNTAQTIIVNNYLGAKYGYSLTSNDIYIQDNVANGNFDFEVAGIGRVDASNLHSDAQGTSIVRMLNATDLNDNEFLLWGHNNGVAGAVHYTDIPASVDARFDRVWRVSEVNVAGTSVDVGGVDMRWNLNGLGAITVTDLRLLVDTDNDGLFADETPKGGAIDLGGGIYEFSNVTELTNNVRFTIATINSVQTPLPIELVNFDARPISNEVVVSWQTASEINNDYFTIEKSIDGENWTTVTEVDGAGNSTSLLSYQTIDRMPYTGLSYYRLKQTDFDGHYSYSDVKTVRFELPISFIRITPNPSSDFITVNCVYSNDNLPQIVSINGQNVTAICTLTRLNSATTNIDIRNLSAGVYILTMGQHQVRFIKY